MSILFGFISLLMVECVFGKDALTCNFTDDASFSISTSKIIFADLGTTVNLTCCLKSLQGTSDNGKLVFDRANGAISPKSIVTQNAKCIKEITMIVSDVAVADTGEYRCLYYRSDITKRHLCETLTIQGKGNLEVYSSTYSCEAIDFTNGTVFLGFNRLNDIVNTGIYDGYVFELCHSLLDVNDLCRSNASVWYEYECQKQTKEGSIVCPLVNFSSKESPNAIYTNRYAYKIIGKAKFVEVVLFYENAFALKVSQIVQSKCLPSLKADYFLEVPAKVSAYSTSAVIELQTQTFLLENTALLNFYLSYSDAATDDELQVLSSEVPLNGKSTFELRSLQPCSRYVYTYHFYITMFQPYSLNANNSFTTAVKVPEEVQKFDVNLHGKYIIAEWESNERLIKTHYNVRFITDSKTFASFLTKNNSVTFYLDGAYNECFIDVQSCNRCNCSRATRRLVMCSNIINDNQNSDGGGTVLLWSILASFVIVMTLLIIVFLIVRHKKNARQKAEERESTRIRIEDPLYEDVMATDEAYNETVT